MKSYFLYLHKKLFRSKSDFYIYIGLKSYFLYLHQSYGVFFVFPSSVLMIVKNLGKNKKNFSKAAKKYKFQVGGPAGGECKGESAKKKEKKVCSDNLKALLQENGKRNPDSEKVKSLRNKSGSKVNLKKKEEEEGTLFSEEDFEKFASSYFIKSK